MFRDYYASRAWLEGFIPQIWTRKELGLERVSHLLKLLGNPQNKFKSIHIAGTSGKGSTAFYIARLLQYSKLQTPKSKIQKKDNWNLGFGNWKLRPKIGLHISPHLVDIRERLQINGRLIPMNRFIRLIGKIKPAVEAMRDSRVGYPSYFEILVAASFLYFVQEKVDWTVVEVGLGGRLDATNILQPQITLITNVGLDHTEILGTKVEKIAWEKAGIIKAKVSRVSKVSEVSKALRKSRRYRTGIPVITGATGRALEVIEKAAREKNAPLIKVDTQSAQKVLKSDAFRSINLPIDIFRSSPYSFAFSNKLLALAAVKTLGIPLSKGQMGKALNSTFPGRFEEIENGVILDGAHNGDKIRALIQWIKARTTDYRLQTTAVDGRQKTVDITLVVAFKKGKDWKKMVDLLVKNLPVSKVIATKFYAVTDMEKYAAVEPKEIAEYVRSVYGLQTTVYSNSHEAVFEVLRLRSGSSTLILIAGSLYLAGEVRTMWKLPDF